ncbi:hypothetical protein RFM41_18950 [Mesorhizobium sp. VK25A]|uniref:Uncharacterized protein n=1 Tax=Mesorhizobium vachelliae TaxID=3072309 RepID=A0ABU4ZW34_9HYPH|nr:MULTISPECIES: hypothetical protein [unclassified Mesorhizobium]MDX8529624.1 hypothetical protein [Mesorhizobium sp. VK25D]MDX8545834.1 hypothetical protein [Mesorhizobium sp. VK25A]
MPDGFIRRKISPFSTPERQFGQPAGMPAGELRQAVAAAHAG